MADKILFPDEEVISTKYFVVKQDWEVPIVGFFILSPKRKLRSISEFTDEEAAEFAVLLRKIREGMEGVLDVKEAYLFQNEDSKHNFHLWIFPRYDWMAKFGGGIQSVRPIMEHAEKNMATKEVATEVKGAVKKMKEYMRDF